VESRDLSAQSKYCVSLWMAGLHCLGPLLLDAIHMNRSAIEFQNHQLCLTIMLDNCCEDLHLGPASLSSPLSSESSPFTPSGPRGYPCTPSAARRSLPPNKGFRNVLSRIFHRAASVLLPVFCISSTLCSHQSRLSNSDRHQQLLINPVRP